MKKYNVTKKELLELLKLAYKNGMESYADLKESIIENLIESLKEADEAVDDEWQIEDDFMVKEGNTVISNTVENNYFQGDNRDFNEEYRTHQNAFRYIRDSFGNTYPIGVDTSAGSDDTTITYTYTR